MSYSIHRGLGVDAGTYASGAQFVGGFQVRGLPASSANIAKQKLRDAVAASFPMGNAAPVTQGQRDSVNWGPAYGVPSGRLYAVVTLNRDGVSGDAINTAFIAVARDLKRRLGNLTVNLTNAHPVGGTSTPLPALTPDVGPDGGPAPVDPGGTMSPLAVGGLALGGLAVLGLGTVLVMSLRRRPVARNRRRR